METPIAINPEEERKAILAEYSKLLRAISKRITEKDKLKLIRKAFDIALDAHKDMRRKSGEPYIYHPIGVAQIVASEIGLGPISIISALLHDVVEDTAMTLDEIAALFGPTVAKIIDGLTKIAAIDYSQNTSIQVENFRKILLTLSDDIRVILVKIADRLHNMRTLQAMPREKQLKIASETLFLYAPLAHRLGLYNIKTELEDLSLKYTEPEIYETISTKLAKTEAVRKRFINQFMLPIKEALTEKGFDFEIKGRPKSIYSIYNKMKTKEVSFDEIYDIFAIRIILNSPPETEKADCWRVYSIITDFYQPNPERLRDWISRPKSNGYESLHTTVMSPTGKWVEVQIRSKRMDEIAEKGYAAHWRYKEDKAHDNAIDEWLQKIREILENPNQNAFELIDEFKLNLLSEEIFVFTPQGKMITLPAQAKVIDFAYEIHTDIGNTCIGAKINNKLVPLSHPLKSGDQIEILTSQTQTPQEEWLKYVVTSKAKNKIKAAINETRKKMIEEGRKYLERYFIDENIDNTPARINALLQNFRLAHINDLYYMIAKGTIRFAQIKDFFKEEKKQAWYQTLFKYKSLRKNQEKTLTEIEKKLKASQTKETMVIGDDLKEINYKLSTCCNPIPGDEIFGFLTPEGIEIHKTNCQHAVKIFSNYSGQVVKARWTDKQKVSFLAGIKISGIDDVGIVNNITRIISNELNVNMKAISFETNDGIFEGTIYVYVHDTNHLKNLMEKLKKAKSVLAVKRIDNTQI